jgi:hypothetical protein
MYISPSFSAMSPIANAANLAFLAEVGQDLVRLTNIGGSSTSGGGHPPHRGQSGEPAVQGRDQGRVRLREPLSREQARPQLWIGHTRRERCYRRCGLHLTRHCRRASQGAIDRRERQVDLPAIVAQP